MFKVLTPVNLYHPRPVEFDATNGDVKPGEWVKLVSPKKYTKMGPADVGTATCRMSRVDTSKITTVGIDNSHEPYVFTDANNTFTVMDKAEGVRVITDQIAADTYVADDKLTIVGGQLIKMTDPATEVLSAYYEGEGEGAHIVILLTQVV